MFNEYLLGSPPAHFLSSWDDGKWEDIKDKKKTLEKIELFSNSIQKNKEIGGVSL